MGESRLGGSARPTGFILKTEMSLNRRQRRQQRLRKLQHALTPGMNTKTRLNSLLIRFLCYLLFNPFSF